VKESKMTARKNKDGVYVINDSIECDRDSFETTAEGIKSYVDLIVAKAKEKGMVGEGVFDFNVCSTYYDSCVLVVKYYFDRAENAFERGDREAAEAKVKAAATAKRKAAAEKKKLKADAEYAEFLRLKEKFGALEK
jgi:hypothetical protein